MGGESLVVTFDPHPRLMLDPECGMRLLTSTEEKCRLLSETGIDNLLIIPFDHAFSRTAPADFIRLLVERVGVRSLVVGYDHHFGCDKQGNSDLLEQLKGEWGLRVTEVAEQIPTNEHVSSTVIRHLIEKGELAHAARLLGRNYLLHAHVSSSGSVHAIEPHKLLPADGLYRVKVGEKEYNLNLVNGNMQLECYKKVADNYFMEFIK